jgi:SLT domain-containing protein
MGGVAATAAGFGKNGCFRRISRVFNTERFFAQVQIKAEAHNA